ncbi:COQ9 family protein [Roseovarius sp. LXJ103]|uniref:COQ9 family protein n=1 Tax=Roseovarius carneus TaxID=2853164 RepID=UPI000D610F9D|nr:COQ9 family protein [Roseovarius carneus]MBZ8118665.1 COQ9 family protein [Roseovarius carneus]PWE35652.1 COQ9 family protein [Pelagicola sp. LXJ1103]
MSDSEIKAKLLDAATMHVPFDGWSEGAFQASARDAGIDIAVARAVCPRGAVDLALAFHAAGDAAMLERLAATDLSDMRFRDRVAAAVRFRLEAAQDKEMVRRGTALFALPHHSADGARAIWQTCDHIWTALGDTSEDVNWYTKRAMLSAVYGSTVLYWLGDQSMDDEATWAFLDRRIDNVMQIETVKAKARESKILGPLINGPLGQMMSHIRAPKGAATDLPGRWSGQS